MKTELILIFIQSLFLILYGLTNVIRSSFKNYAALFGIVALFLILIITSLFLSDHAEKYFQWLLLLFLVLNYFQSSFYSNTPKWSFRMVDGGIVLTGIYLLYFAIEHILAFVLILLLVFFPLFLSKKWHLFLAKQNEYLLKVGTFLTIFFLLEPVLIDVQKNLKPIATIPTDFIINQHNLIVLGGLFLLLLLGYITNEKLKL